MPNRLVHKINLSLCSGLDGGIGNVAISTCPFPSNLANQLLFCVQDPRSIIKYALIGDNKAPALFLWMIRTSNEKRFCLAVIKNIG